MLLLSICYSWFVVATFHCERQGCIAYNTRWEVRVITWFSPIICSFMFIFMRYSIVCRLMSSIGEISIYFGDEWRWESFHFSCKLWKFTQHGPWKNLPWMEINIGGSIRADVWSPLSLLFQRRNYFARWIGRWLFVSLFGTEGTLRRVNDFSLVGQSMWWQNFALTVAIYPSF
jgi:hypothetical protein